MNLSGFKKELKIRSTNSHTWGLNDNGGIVTRGGLCPIIALCGDMNHGKFNHDQWKDAAIAINLNPTSADIIHEAVSHECGNGCRTEVILARAAIMNILRLNELNLEK